ncbi:MAG: hypothetical protein JWM11_2430, partial [Planctomycetaceae bacterium]|nr:hypothetical protein [Planctomycetaceae bacterium]
RDPSGARLEGELNHAIPLKCYENANVVVCRERGV